jgi:glutamate dehydrogenase/leucine dehydrogenase
MKEKKLLALIEDLRAELQQVLGDKDITDPDVLRKSRELDEILNEYNRLLLKQTR